ASQQMTNQSVFDRVPNCVGALICGPDGNVLQSQGQLNNREDLAKLVLGLLYRAEYLLQQSGNSGCFQSVTVHCDDGFHYVITCQHDKIYVVKKSNSA
ncbi:hypothetical protein BOX15_Mlig022374g2, partial [Macrostomum lignano]